MKIINILNENGNVIPAVRTAIREQVINHITTATHFISGPNGLYCMVGEAQDGSPIYACLELSISLADPTIKKNKNKKVIEKEPIILEDLFGE